MIGDLGKLLEPMRRQVNGMVRRVIVTNVDDTPQRQELQLQDGAGADGAADVLPTVEHFQPMGVRSFPPAGTGAIALAIGGFRNHFVAMVASAKLKLNLLVALASGDVAFHCLNPDVWTHLQNGGAWLGQGATQWFVTLKGLKEFQYIRMLPQETVLVVQDPAGANFSKITITPLHVTIQTPGGTQVF
jgi:hypothetical protein